MYYIIDIAKALACLLIANFHSDILFPDNLSLLAFGGDIGNNIFFMVSGFALLPSVEKCASGVREFGKWFLKRVLRLLPMLIFFYLLTWLTGGIVIADFASAIRAFVFPTIYWFTGAIIIFYFIYFLLEKYTNAVVRGTVILLLILWHLYRDDLSAEIYFIGFISMLLGAWLRRNISLLGIKTKTKNILPLIFITGIFYMFLKLFRRSGVEVLGFIHLGIGLLTICLAMEIILWGAAYEDKLKDFFEKHPKMSLIVKNLSAITLAVYLFMGLDDRIIMQTVKEYLSFPLSYIINMAISLVGAYVITTIDKKLHALKK